MGSEFEVAVERLRDGRATFEEFARDTRDRWASMAGWLLRQRRVPGWVEHEDVVQELLMGAWRATWDYDPGRGGMPLERYVRVAAVFSARKRLSKARGVDQHTQSGEGHFDLPLAHLSERAEAFLLGQLSVEPEQERGIERRQRLLEACESYEEIVCVQALMVAGSFEGAAALLCVDEDVRVLLRLEGEDDAARVVVRAAYAVALRAEAHRNSSFGDRWRLKLGGVPRS